MAQQLANPTSIHEDTGSIPGSVGEGSGVAMSQRAKEPQQTQSLEVGLSVETLLGDHRLKPPSMIQLLQRVVSQQEALIRIRVLP